MLPYPKIDNLLVILFEYSVLCTFYFFDMLHIGWAILLPLAYSRHIPEECRLGATTHSEGRNGEKLFALYEVGYIPTYA